MEMSNKSVKHEVLNKQYLRSILDISGAGGGGGGLITVSLPCDALVSVLKNSRCLKTLPVKFKAVLRSGV